jgi:hypothetical protein
VASVVRVDTHELASDARSLADAAVPIPPPAATPPAADPVSQGVTIVLGAHSGALSTLVEHSAALRVHGGAALAQTAAILQDADNERATALAATLGGTPSPSARPEAIAPVPPPPPEPAMPEIPAMVRPPTLPGDQFSVLIHNGGPGSSGLRDFSDAWRAHAARLDELAEQVVSRGDAIDEHWFDGGNQRAGANTREHGYWLRETAERARTIATAATEIAGHFDAARHATPTPDEFDQTRSEYLAARARKDPIGATQALQKYATMQAQAAEAATGYHSGATAATNRVGAPLPTAPAIASSGSGIQLVSNTIRGGFKQDGNEEHDPFTGATENEPQAKTPLPPQFDPETGVAEGGGAIGGGEGGEGGEGEAGGKAAGTAPLPNADAAVIDPAKFQDYSMDPTNPQNNGKWQAWQQIGFNVDTQAGRVAATQDVLQQLKTQLPTAPATPTTLTQWGSR